ncbi:unnamed protein product [Pleuronectes platessa]|uniref:Uncharacterized protein n=1 Tax=Pleuronectes platessa TaxID=8262 RepID=A0A9N7VFK1_PLEPL|nr:unnamed protein product [Pleuronectes platessa]
MGRTSGEPAALRTGRQAELNGSCSERNRKSTQSREMSRTQRREVSQRAELQHRQFSTVERAHQTSALLPLRADNMGPSHLLGASEPLLLPLNELQRGGRIDRNTERAVPSDWRSCQGEPKVLSQARAAFHKAAPAELIGS